MPNWCNNTMLIEHDDIKMMRRVVRAYNRSRLFSEFIPTPPELMVGSTMEEIDAEFKWNDEYRKEMKELRQKLNTKYYGYPSWYEWRLMHWGTKWDTGKGDSDLVLTPDCARHPIYIGFDTAWSPPTQAYERLAEMGFRIKAYYYEEGMLYCGKWTNDSDDYYEIKEDKAEWVVKNIPNDIDEEFCISENILLNEEFDETH